MKTKTNHQWAVSISHYENGEAVDGGWLVAGYVEAPDALTAIRRTIKHDGRISRPLDGEREPLVDDAGTIDESGTIRFDSKLDPGVTAVWSAMREDAF